MDSIDAEKTDRAGYNDLYKGNLSAFVDVSSREEYIEIYEANSIGPYYRSGNTKGYVRGEAIRRLVADTSRRGLQAQQLTVLDAGSGQGELSVYLACKGFNVIGVDISAEAKNCGEYLASRVGVKGNCTFLAESLESTSIGSASVDYLIGHASLHHFIKYEGVPKEFLRVMKPEARGYFADSFGENRFYHIFHNKEEMHRLGDVTLTKELVEAFYRDFDVYITPTDWLVMLDKLYLKMLPKSAGSLIRGISRIHYWLDRRIPASSRLSLFLSGSVLTEIRNRNMQL